MMPVSTTTRRIHLSRRKAPCPCCGSVCRRHCTARRRLREIGITGPTVLVVMYSKHYCGRCRKHFSVDMSHLAPAYGRFTHRVRRTAVELVVALGCTLERATQRMQRRHYVHVPPTTLHDWVVADLTAA